MLELSVEHFLFQILFLEQQLLDKVEADVRLEMGAAPVHLTVDCPDTRCSLSTTTNTTSIVTNSTSTVSTTKNNLLANMPEKTDPHKVNIAMTKNSTNTSSMLNKCKRIYL